MLKTTHDMFTADVVMIYIDMCILIFVYAHVHSYVNICAYIERECERKRDRESVVHPSPRGSPRGHGGPEALEIVNY